MAALLPLIIQAFTAAVAAAPGAVALLQQFKDVISTLFSSGAITKTQEQAAHDHIDSIFALFAAGVPLPVHWTVEPDPVTPQPPPTPPAPSTPA